MLYLHGYEIDLSQLRDVKSLADLKKHNIFSGLPNEKEATTDLWNAIKPVDKTPDVTNIKPE